MGQGARVEHGGSLERLCDHPEEEWWLLKLWCWWRRWRQVDLDWIWRGWREVSRMTSRVWLFNRNGLWCHSLDQVFSWRCLRDIEEELVKKAAVYERLSEERTRLEIEIRESSNMWIWLIISRIAFQTSGWTSSKWQKIHHHNHQTCFN